MSTGRNRSALSYIPGLSGNAVLKLIIFSSVVFVIYAIAWAIVALLYQGDGNFNQYFIPAVALPHITNLKDHWWGIFTYGLFHYPNGFWELLSNMLWLYCFGSVVQMLLGHKQVIPMYLYCLLGGGVFYLLAQLLPGSLGACPPYILGPRAGLIGFAAAAVTLTPKYQFYLTETFRIPLLVVAGIFAALMVLGSGYWLPVVFMLIGGALTGFSYVKLLQAGYRPGEWMHQLTGKVESLVTPDENAEWKKHNKKRNEALDKMYAPKQGISQKRIDDILDKINQKGYNSLSSEEKDILVRAGKE
jgi:membrane associated rhomboid family serine protease